MRDTSINKNYANECVAAGKITGATIDLTQRCNCRCEFCFKEETNDYTELTTKEVKEVIDSLRELGCYQIQFSGGEPFLRNDVTGIIRYTKQLNLKVIVSTNANLLTDYIIQQLKGMYVDLVICSFQAIREKTWNSVISCSVHNNLRDGSSDLLDDPNY